MCKLNLGKALINSVVNYQKSKMLDDDFHFGLYELDWDVFGKHVEVATTRIPKLKDIGCKSTICGPESFTPDHKPIMGTHTLVPFGYLHG